MIRIAIVVAALGLFIVLASAQTTDPDANWPCDPILLDIPPTLDSRAVSISLDETATDLDPGLPPEGDYLGALVFSPDGNRVFVCNRTTDNFTVFEWGTMQPVATIPTGTYPSDLVVTENRIVVSCAFSDEVRVYDTGDFMELAAIPTGEQPWVIHLSADGRYAYVACDISNTCEVIDLDSLISERTISNFPIGLRTWSANSASGRNDFGFTDFVVSPNGEHLIVNDCDGHLFFFNTATGTIDDTVSGIPHCVNVALSGDGAKLMVASPSNPARIYRVDLTSRAVDDSVVLSNTQLSFQGLGVNADGSKCYTGIDNNRSALVRFATHDFITFSQTYTAFWIGVLPSHRYVISGQYRFSVIDFVTEQVVGQAIGYGQYRGVTSPTGMQVASHNPFGLEGVMFFDIQTPSAPVYRGLTLTGLAPEGDAPHHAAITPDGTKAVVTNFLSNNVTIINLSTLERDTILENVGDGPWEVAMTSDSRWAVVCGYNSHSVYILDLLTNEVVATIPTNLRPCTVRISPDDAAAYVGNIQANTISVIALAGANSTEVTEIPCGVIGVLWASYGVFSGMAISPNGRYLLVAASFDDVVSVIDAWTYSVVASLPVGEFPLEVVFADDEYAVAASYFANSYSVLHIDGPNSQVVGTFPSGDSPLRVAYNPVEDVVGIAELNGRTVRRVNPRTGAVTGTTDYSSYGGVLQVAYGPSGDEMVMTTSSGTGIPPQLHRGDEHTALPATPAYFALSSSGETALVTMPGPDWVTVVEYEPVNHPPTPFSLLLPANNDTVAETVNLAWQASRDPDPTDTLSYAASFWLLSTGIDTTVMLWDVTDTSQTINLMDLAGISEWHSYVRVQWYVMAISRGDTVRSRETWTFRMAPPSAAEWNQAEIPEQFGVCVYPNPFNNTTTIELALPRTERARVQLYDVMGRLADIVHNGMLAAGTHRMTVNAGELASGIYFVRVNAGPFEATRKVMLTK